MGKAAYDPGSAPAKDRSQCLKKNRGGTSERRQLERSTAAHSQARGYGPCPPDPLVRAFKTWGILCGSGCRCVPAPTFLLPAPFRVPEAWFGAGAGLSRRGCLTALTGLQIPARLRSATWFRAPEWHRASLDSEAFIDFDLAWNLFCRPNLSPVASSAKTRFSGSGIGACGFSSYSVGFADLPTCSFLSHPEVQEGPMDSKERSKGDGNCVLRPFRNAASRGDLVL